MTYGYARAWAASQTLLGRLEALAEAAAQTTLNRVAEIKRNTADEAAFEQDV